MIHIPGASHQPLIRCLLELSDPKFILELGVGDYSTPLLLIKNVDKMISIENSLEWIEHVKSKFEISSNYEIRFHDLGPDIGQFTFTRDLSQQQLENIASYYRQLEAEINQQPSPKLLFVDNFTACRTISINVLSSLFDVIIYHDCEPGPNGAEFYNYFDIRVSDKFDLYELQTPTSWTGCFVHKDLSIGADQMKLTLRKYLTEFCTSYDQNLKDWRLVRYLL